MRPVLAWTAKLALFAALVALAVRALRSIAWSELESLVFSADWLWLLAAAVLLAGRPVAWGERWRLVARRLGMTPAPAWSVCTVAAAIAVDHLTPTARLFGAFLRARWIARKYQQRIGHSFGSVLYETLTHEVFMALATMCALVLMPALLGRWWVAFGIALLAGFFPFAAPGIGLVFVAQLELLHRMRRVLAGLFPFLQGLIVSLPFPGLTIARLRETTYRRQENCGE